MGSVYHINKGINKSIEFKGLKAQYIGYLVAGVLGLMVAFAILYILGVPVYVCVVLILVAGGVLVSKVYRLSHRYGEHGLMKAIARKRTPNAIVYHTREAFVKSKKT